MNDIATAMTAEFTKNLKAAIGTSDDATPASPDGAASRPAASTELVAHEDRSGAGDPGALQGTVRTPRPIASTDGEG